MPDLTLKVAASADDAYEFSGNTDITAVNLLNIDGTGEWGGLIFRGVTTEEGAVFADTFLRANLPTSSLDEPDIRIYGLATATPAAFTAGGGNNISGRARTTAYVDWINTNLGAPGWFDSPDLSAILQELHDAYGPYTDGAIGLVYTSRANDGARDFVIAAWDSGDHSLAAELHIGYTVGANEAPTITPNTADATEFRDNTPTLELTGADADDDDLRYQVQISTDVNFALSDGVNLADGMDVAASAGSGGLHSNGVNFLNRLNKYHVDDRFGMSCTGQGGILDHVAFILETDTADTDGYAIARVYAHQGTFGTSSEPLNPAEPADTPTPGWLAESAPVYFDNTLTRSWQSFNFYGANRITLEDGTHYVVVLDWQPATGTYDNLIECSQVNPATHPGNAYIDGYSEFNNGVRTDFDVYFQVYEEHTVITATSGTDAGFANTVTGGDTDPFNAGEKIGYTVQTALPNGVYFWRARALDPAGLNTWSAWTDARVFTVEAVEVYALTAAGIATGAPTVGNPALAQIHALTAAGIATGAPTVGNPTLAQIHALTATGIATGAPTVGSPTLAQIHALTATGIATGAPTVGSPTLGTTGAHGLTAAGIATGAPTVGNPALTQIHALTAAGIATGAPTVGNPALTQIHALTAAGIATGAPTVGSPTLAQIHALTAAGIATGAPTVGNPTLSEGWPMVGAVRDLTLPARPSDLTLQTRTLDLTLPGINAGR